MCHTLHLRALVNIPLASVLKTVSDAPVPDRMLPAGLPSNMHDPATCGGTDAIEQGLALGAGAEPGTMIKVGQYPGAHKHIACHDPDDSMCWPKALAMYQSDLMREAFLIYLDGWRQVLRDGPATLQTLQRC